MSLMTLPVDTRSGSAAAELAAEPAPASTRRASSFDTNDNVAPDPGIVVTLLGLDEAGRRIASALVKAGYRVTVCDPTMEAVERVAPEGAVLGDSVRDACCSADAVFTSFSGDELIEALVLGVDGLIEALPRNAIHISTGTMSVECSDRLVEAHWDAGQRYLSAPVIEAGRTGATERLSMIVGGCADTIAEVAPLLDLVGDLVGRFHGWPSMANAAQQEFMMSL